MKWILFVVRPLFYDLVMTEMIIDLLKMTATMQYIWDFIISQILSGVEACQLKVATYFSGPYPCSLYPGLPVIQILAKFFESSAVWQNEKDSVPADYRTSPQGATLKSCSNKRPQVEV